MPELANAIRVKTATLNGNYIAQRVTGWDYGFDWFCGYLWVNQDYLVARAVVGESSDEMYGTTPFVAPVAINLTTQHVWMPGLDVTQPIIEAGCTLPRWSSELQRIVFSQNGELWIADANGDNAMGLGGAVSGYVHVSPNGHWLLMNTVLLDLTTGEIIPAQRFGDWFGIPAWSSDERKIFRCCFGYADSDTRLFSSFSLNLNTFGRGCSPGGCIVSHWVGDGTKIIIGEGFEGGEIALIDPAIQSYVDLRVLAGIPTDRRCDPLAFTPNQNDIAIVCSYPSMDPLSQQYYWINLRDLTARTVPEGYRFVSWSPDGRYMLLAQGLKQTNDPTPYVLFTLEGELLVIDDAPIKGLSLSYVPLWGGNKLLYQKRDDANATILDIATWTRVEVPLPFPLTAYSRMKISEDVWAFASQDQKAFVVVDIDRQTTTPIYLSQPYRFLIGNPNGKSLAIQMADNSLWMVTDITTGEVEQMTQPVIRLSGAQWSPSGERLVFISDSDLYVVAVP